MTIKRGCVVMVMLLLAAAAWPQSTDKKSGRCGDIEWKFDGRTLAIYSAVPKKQSVAIPDFDLNENIAPWKKQKLAVHKVVIGHGIGRIGSCAFARCDELTSVEFSDVFVWEIGWGAFLNCTSLFNFSIPINVKRIDAIAFANCSSLRSVRIPGLARVGKKAFASCTNLSLIDIGYDVLLDKDVFVTEVNQGQKVTHTCYTGEIRNLPANVNTDNCTEYGLDPEAVSLCLQRMQPHKAAARVSLLDTEIPDGATSRNDTYALIIGNETYMRVAPVPFATNDAKVFALYCQKTLGIPTANIHVCLNATKHMILEEEMEDWLQNEIQDKADKKLIVYYAGHGVPDIKDNNKSYLLPIDVYGTKPHHGIALDAFYETLGSMGFEVVTVFIDACFSGVNRNNNGVNEERAVEVEAQDTKPTTGNLVVFSAAQGNETAQSYQDEGHGLFTYYLLKELKETNGMLSYGELDRAVKKNVSNVSTTLELRKKQTPKTVSSHKGNDWKNLEF